MTSTGSATLMCTRCVYDEGVPGIAFDIQGVCNYCAVHDELNRQYPTGVEGAALAG